MSEARHTYECRTYEQGMSHVWTRHVTHMNAAYMNEACHTYERGTSHVWLPHIWARHVTHMNEVTYECRIYERGTSLIYMACFAQMPTGLFCERALLKRLYSAKETYIFKEPTNVTSCLAHICGTHMCDVPRSFTSHIWTRCVTHRVSSANTKDKGFSAMMSHSEACPTLEYIMTHIYMKEAAMKTHSCGIKCKYKS